MKGLRSQLNIHSIEDIRYNHQQWFDHIQPMNADTRGRKIVDLNISGEYSYGRPKKIWLNSINHDFISLCLNKEKAQDCVECRNAIRLTIQTCCKLIDGKTQMLN